MTRRLVRVIPQMRVEVYRIDDKTRADELQKALQELCDAEEEYGDDTNVAVNQAWEKAKRLLMKLGAKQ